MKQPKVVNPPLLEMTKRSHEVTKGGKSTFVGGTELQPIRDARKGRKKAKIPHHH